MNRRLLSASGSLCLLASVFLARPSLADNATVSTNPPAYPSGSNSTSMTPSGGLRVQPQDGAGNDVSPSHPLSVTSSTLPTNAAQETGGNLAAIAASVAGATPAGTNSIGTVQPGNTANTTPWLTANGRARTILTSGSATACTSLQTIAGQLVSVVNTGPATSVFLTLYDEGTSPTCAAADVIYGDGTTLTFLAGQVVNFTTPLTAGLAYKLSGALTSNLIIVRD